MPMPINEEFTYALAIYPIPQHPHTTEHLRQYFFNWWGLMAGGWVVRFQK
jgi:hypothetical protein